MSLSRRQTLALIGGGVVLAAGGTVGHIATRSPDSAFAPWQAAGGYTEVRRHALSYAILAPNPHNRQPWTAELIGEDRLRIFRDREKNLPHTDPYERQLTVGMGCFLELLSLAAAERGYAVDFTLFPEGEDGPIADALFRTGAAPDPLFAHVLDRRSCKEPFEDRAVPDDLATALNGYADIYRDPAMVAKIKDLTWESWVVEAETPHTYKESVDLMRLGKAEIEANPDGIDLGGGFLELLIAGGAMSRESLLDPTTMSYQEGFNIYSAMLFATPAYAVITSNGNSREDQIGAGRRWLRLNLATTGLGLALHPVSQALQEYPEMATHYQAAHDLLAGPGQTVQMLGRLGYGPTVTPAPRWPMERKLKNG